MLYIIKKDKENYTDLRNLKDDKSVLTNPHKGWYLHFIDNGVRRPVYRDELNGPEDILDIPGMPFLYLRIDWNDIEKAKGVFDWSYIDSIIETYSAKGYKFMFRFCTYELAEFDATPKWVFEEGAKYNVVHTTFESFEPVYDDPIFKKYLELFIKECARKFDGKSFTESVDVGTFGTWGEGHTSHGSQKTYSTEALKWHVDVHLKYFKNTHLEVNDDFIRHVYSFDNGNQSRFLADYCKNSGMGIRDDSINVRYYAEKMGYDTLVAPDLLEYFNDTAPVNLEFEHYNAQGPERFADGFRHLEAIRNTKATYAGFHGHASQWYSQRKNMHDYLANRLGYWYFINGFALAPLKSNTPCVLSLDVENKGFSKAYHDFTFKVLLEDETKKRTTVFEGSANNKEWLPEKEVTCELTLNLDGVKSGIYKLLIGLFEDDTPIKLALSKTLYTDGFYQLGTVEVE